jgi:hypothetical protein
MDVMSHWSVLRAENCATGYTTCCADCNHGCGDDTALLDSWGLVLAVCKGGRSETKC